MSFDCPAIRRRADMTDDEFWVDVAASVTVDPMGTRPDDDPLDPPDGTLLTEPCGVCGATGACAYDMDGLPLIHAIDAEDAEDAEDA